jgi:1-aminocyclopropane-1-carboxylate deaminase
VALVVTLLPLRSPLGALEGFRRSSNSECDDRYHAGTYGIPDHRTLDAIRLAACLEGMLTDPVYEGKSMAGLIDLVVSGEIEKSSTCCTPTWAASRR